MCMLRMCVDVLIYLYIDMCVYVWIYVYIDMCVYVNLCADGMRVCVCEFMYLCICMLCLIRMCVFMYLCICM